MAFIDATRSGRDVQIPVQRANDSRSVILAGRAALTKPEEGQLTNCLADLTKALRVPRK